MKGEERILSLTGHRPPKLGGYDKDTKARLYKLALASIEELAPTLGISGMALGWDMAGARAFTKLGIPWIAAVPFDGQESLWPLPTRCAYYKLLREAKSIKYVCAPGYAAWKMQVRNRWMVDNSTRLLALWDGSPGGTANCCVYAQSKGKPITNVWSRYVG